MLTSSLAAWISGLRPGQVPIDVRRELRLLSLDTFGCALSRKGGVVERQCGYTYEPGTALNAQMSARYAIAVALQHGAVLPAQFEPACMTDPQTVALANAIEIVHDERHDKLYPANFCGWTEIETGDGSFERVEVLNPSGAASNARRPEAIRAKFAALTARMLGADTSTRVQAGFEQFDQASLCSLLDSAVVHPS